MEKIKPFYVLDVPVYPYTMDGAVNFLNSQVKNKKQTFVVTANAEIIMMCQKDAEYKKIVCQNADLVLADGAGTVWAGRKLGHNVPERVAGCDLFVELAKLSAKKGYKVFFFGAAPGIAEAARDKLLQVAPGLKAAATVILPKPKTKKLLPKLTQAVRTCFLPRWAHRSRKTGWRASAAN
mgnify:CR=1 FL=1